MMFDKKLNLTEWTKYLENFTLSRSDISYNEKSYPFVEEVYQAGTLEVSEGDIPVFYLKLTQTKMNTRVKISQLIQHIIPNNFDYTSALAFIEYSDESYQGLYRLSYVKIDRDYNQTTGKYETIKSNPRRYTFVLGEGLPTHTPNQQLKASAFRSIPSIEEAFSVEPVNKEFYKAIQEHFDNIIASVSSTLNSQDAKQFALRFLGRILFCWFLREKELIPRNLLKSSEVKNKYYNSTLESLFFDVLNQAYGTRTKLLDHEKKIPFLNGGLFTPQDDDHKGKILIDDKIIKKLFETFELYNFTVDESTPSNIEMSIDPEMLGRVFENLLAEIDENTGDSARKSTGSFYTPREIVDYMVVESLKQYFKNNLKLDDELLDFMFNSIEEASSNPLLCKKTEDILNAIHKIKILDPACGSGAFPMGILQRIFILIERLDPTHNCYKKTLLSSIPDEYARRKFEEYANKEQFDYAYKMKILKDCIYGVDIQESATEISRLRAFLSLIVEEKIDDTKDNRGIEPLPNLQFQFITANSLVGLDMELDTDTLEGTQINYFITKIQEISKETFSASTPKEKQQLENRFEALMEELQKNNWIEDEDKQLLSSYHPFKNSSCEFFEPHIQFGIDKDRNFDIVIANPPYVEARNSIFSDEMKKSYQKYMKKDWTISDINYVSKLTQGVDLSIYFYLKGLKIINDKGSICYICTNSWMSTKYGVEFQKFLIQQKLNIELTDSNFKHFSTANVNTIISTISKSSTCTLKLNFFDNRFSSNNLISQFCIQDHNILKNHKWSVLTHVTQNKLLLDVLNKLNTGSVIQKFNLDVGQGLNGVEPSDVQRLNSIPFCHKRVQGQFSLTNTEYFIDKKNTSSRNAPAFILPRGVGSTYFCMYNPIQAYSNSYVEIYYKSKNIPIENNSVLLSIWIFYNSTLGWLLREINGRSNLGGGLLKAEAIDIKNIPCVFDIPYEKSWEIYTDIKDINILPVSEEIITHHHKKIDELLYSIIGINTDEKIMIEKLFIDIVNKRIRKSKNTLTKKSTPQETPSTNPKDN